MSLTEKISVTVQLTDVLVTIECPHEAVDTETILDVARAAVRTGGGQLIPRWHGHDESDGPRFSTFVEICDEPEIQDDDRVDAPEEFEPDCRWWVDLKKERV